MGWIALFVQLAVPLIVYGTATFGPWIQQSPSSANPFPSRAYLAGGVYAEGRYWVVGSGVCASSTTGELWTGATVERFGGNRSSAIAAGPMGLVATEPSHVGSMYYSATGEVWTQLQVPQASGSYEEVVYADGRFVAAGSDIATSTNGSTWRVVWNAVPRIGFCGVVRGTSGWVAVTVGGRIFTSSDAETWQEQTSVSPGCIGITFGGGRYIVVSFYGGIYSSTDAVNWQRVDFPRLSEGGELQGVVSKPAYVQGLFLFSYGRELLTSPDGENWTVHEDVFASSSIRRIFSGGGRAVAIGDEGVIFRSAQIGPVIEQQPRGEVVLAGQSVTLSVITSAGTTLQWFEGQSGDITRPIPGATAATYTTGPVATAAAYWVRTTDSSGSSDSATATVRLAVTPTITSQPSDLDPQIGDSISLTVSATGLPAPTFQWYRGASGDVGQPIAGATSSTLSLSAPEEVGRYWVRVTNMAGSVDSAAGKVVSWRRIPQRRFWTRWFNLGDRVCVGAHSASPAGATMPALFSTTNLQDWQEDRTPMLAPLNAVTNEAGTWVVVCDVTSSPPAKQIFYSTDTRQWTQATMPAGYETHGVSDVAYGNGRFVVVGYRVLFTSTDGRNWTAVPFGPNVGDSIRTIYFDGTKFVGGGDAYAAGYNGISVGAVFTSTDGLTWTRRYLSPFSAPTPHPDMVGSIARIKKLGDRLVAIGENDYKFMLSPDGVSWTVVGIPGSGPLGPKVRDIGYGNGVYVMGTNSIPALYTSSNAVAWTARTAPASWESLNASSPAITFAQGEFVVARGTTIYTSADGINWRVPAGTPSLQSNMLAAVYRAAGHYVVYSGGSPYPDNYAFRSVDGLVWEPFATPPARNQTYGGGVFVGIDDTQAWRSADGRTWTTGNLPSTAGSYLSVVYAGDRFFAFGSEGKLATSTDGSVWTTQNLTGGPIIRNVVYGAGKFWMLAGSRILSSTDGITWAVAKEFSGSAPGWLLYAAGKFWTDSFVSTDGIAWTARAQPGRAMTYLHGRYYSSAVSDDGDTWRDAAFSSIYFTPDGAMAGAESQVLLASTNTLWLSAPDRYVPPPIITGELTQNVVLGLPFSFQISASGSPTAFNAVGLPPGLTVDLVSGRISGTPTATGTFIVSLAAANAHGRDTKNLTLVIAAPPPPVITIASEMVVARGFPVRFSIPASNTPTSYNALGLPPGLTVDHTSGVISGVPTTLGTFGTQLVAANWGGTAWANLNVRVRLPAPDSLASGIQSDLLLENGRTGERVIWKMSGAEIAGSVGLPTFTSGWHFAGVGDFDRDQRADIVLQNTQTGERVIWLMDVGVIRGSVGLPTLPLRWQFACVGDIDGDGSADIVLQNTDTGERVIWKMSGAAIDRSLGLPTLAPEWQICAVIDIDGDDQNDLVLQNVRTGERKVWVIALQSGQASLSRTLELPTFYAGWRFAGAGFYTTDGKPNLILQNALTGERVLWSMGADGSIVGSTGLPTLPVEWSFAGAATNRAPSSGLHDLTGDGASDILVTDTTSGARVIWAMQNGAIAGSIGLPTLSSQWRFAGIGDFNADGLNDILVENTSNGDRVLWLMNNGIIGGSMGLPTLAVAWRIAAVVDVNLDGQPDIVLQNRTTGERAIWVMDRTKVDSTVALPTLPPTWNIAAGGRFSADGRANLILENTGTGDRVFWSLNPDGTIAHSLGLPTLSVSWSIVGSGDFNGDGGPDIVLENTNTGDRVIWVMDRTNIAHSLGLPTLPPSWSLRN